MLQILVKFDVPALEDININKPIPVTIVETTELTDLVIRESWFLFVVKDLVEEVRKWVLSAEKGEDFRSIESFCEFNEFIKKSQCYQRLCREEY